MTVEFLLLEVSDRAATPYVTAAPLIVGPFGSEDEAEGFAAEHGMGRGCDDYGGARSVFVVRNELDITSPAEAAGLLASYAEEAG